MPEPQPAIVYFDGQFVPQSEARVSVTCPAFAFALQVYDVLGGYWNATDEQLHLFRLREHATRFTESMKLMRFRPEFGVDEIVETVLETVRRNGFRQDTAIRLVGYISSPGGLGDLTATGPVGLLVLPLTWPKASPPGVTAVVSSWPRIPDHIMPPRIKAPANYLNARHAQMEAERAGVDHAIMLNERHKVAEMPRYCIFMARGDEIACPSLTSDQLDSMTRRSCLELLRGPLGRQVNERDLDRTELLLADEVWLGASITGIKAIVQVDGARIGTGEPGPICTELSALLTGVRRGTSALFPEWRTPVY